VWVQTPAEFPDYRCCRSTRQREHCGNLVTYFRVKEMVPPSSRPP